ncbi:MAG: hypothetical protein MUO64_11210 [Anaerolineales bacterium]|nr:hypothetical protein [Anaerolineales bacterium]
MPDITFYDDLITFASPVTYTSSTLTTTSHTPPTMTAGIYYWQVRARDAAGNWSAYNMGGRSPSSDH